MSTSEVPVIAIDGPSASGKGTVAEKVAGALGFHFLDSGALYRLVALAAITHGVELEDGAAVAALARNLDANFHEQRIWMSGSDVTSAIRAEHVGDAASRVAAVASVREALLDRQRAFRRPPGLVADGRDMGSIVFPDATLKVFLTASAEERARRRYKQLMDKGMSANIDALLQDIRERDARDASRAAAPLLKCADAVELDTTALTIEEAVARILEVYSGHRVAE